MRALALALSLGAVLSAQVELPPFSREVMSNGIIVNVMPRRDVPLVTVRVDIRGGYEAEQPSHAGLAGVVAESLRRGTAKRSAEQFSRELDFLGATFLTGADAQSTTVTMEYLSKDFEKGLDLLFDAVLSPSFPEEEIRKVVAQRVDAARALKDNPAAAASAYYRSFFYPEGHPYGYPPDEVTLARITRQDVAEYHKRLYVGRNMIVVAAGDTDASRAIKTIARRLSRVSAGRPYHWKSSGPLSFSATGVAVVDKPDATQTQILLGQPGIERTHPDRVALWLVNTVFGGRFTSILNDELRVNSGLTYGAGSQFDRSHLPGRITISTFTATENTEKTLEMIMKLLKRLTEEGITEEQLSSAKAYLKGTYPSEHLETPDQLADVLAEIELFDMTRGEIDDLFARIDAVTPEKANEVARAHYGSDHFRMLLLGKVDAILPAAKKYDPEPVVVPVGNPGLRVTQQPPEAGSPRP